MAKRNQTTGKGDNKDIVPKKVEEIKPPVEEKQIKKQPQGNGTHPHPYFQDQDE